MKKELKKAAVERKERSMVVPFLAGGLVGAGIALLLAPKSGKEAREDIKDLAVKTKKKIATSIQKGRELHQESTTALSGAIEAGKAAFIDKKKRHLRSA